jgi:hypothetical protein
MKGSGLLAGICTTYPYKYPHKIDTYFKYAGKSVLIWEEGEMIKPSFRKIVCWNCDVEIIQYFDIKYKGERGVCPVCGVNFPLE